MLRMLHYMRYILSMLWTLCRFYVLYVLHTCKLRLLYMLCMLYTLARAHSVRDLYQEPLRHASNLCGPFLCNRANCCVPGPP